MTVSHSAIGLSIAESDTDQRLDEQLSTIPDAPWLTIVWNDPVNLMNYVTRVFREYFGYSREKAERLMLQVHHDGRSVVASGPREEMERHTEALHGYGLWATVDRAEP